MRRAPLSLALVLALGAAFSGVARGQSSVPVMVGDDGADYDACGSLGRVVGLNPRGDNFLAVRLGPSTDFTKVDEIHTGDEVYVCEDRGSWYGIIYDTSGRAVDCGVGSPLLRQRYAGPCRSGWVHRRYVEIFAG